MSIEQNKQIASRIPMELNKGNVGVFDEVVGPNAVEHAAPPGMPPTVESTKQTIMMLRAALPDLVYKIEDTIGEGDFVTQRTTGTGTMTGAFMGMPATGKRATWTEIHIVRFSNGKIVEHWGVVDQMAMMMQLGLIPMPG